MEFRAIKGAALDAPFIMVGASRQWSMALARFQERGMLKLGKRYIEVLQRDRLVKQDHSVNCLTDTGAKQPTI
jgi:hypothetical protein